VGVETWSTSTGSEWQTVKVAARNSDGSTHAYSGEGASFNTNFYGCIVTNGVLDLFTAWADGASSGCSLHGYYGASSHKFKVIKHCTCSGMAWGLYIDDVSLALTPGLFSTADNVRAAGESNGLNSTAHTNFGVDLVWERTSDADDQPTITWTEITSQDASGVSGAWTHGTLPSPWFVDDN
jgi:hypothetical protein